MEHKVNEYLEKIEEMLSNARYDFAEDTLMGIREYINKNMKITEKQQKAVDNIYWSVDL